MRLFDIFEDDINPSDEDLFGGGEIDKVRQAIIDELENILMNYHEWPSLHKHQPVAQTQAEYAAIQKALDTFTHRGVLMGLRSLDGISHNIIDHLDAELAWNHNVILGDIEAKYLREDEPSDDELFGDKSAVLPSAKEFVNIFNNILNDLEAEINASADSDEADYLRYDYSEILNVRSEFIQHGIIGGLKELKEKQADGQIDYFEILSTYGLNLDHMLDNINESEPSDDELFGNEPKRADLTKVATSTLYELLKSFQSDDRPEYANAHASLSFRIKQELERRGVVINEDEPSDSELFGDTPSLIGRKVIDAINELKTQNIARFHQILAANNVDSMSDIDANEEENWDDLDELDELNDHTDALDKMAKIFTSNLEDGLRYYANALDYGYSGTEREIADYVEQLVMEKFNLNMRELTKELLGIDVLHENTIAEPEEPSRPQKTQTKPKPTLDPNTFGPRADQPLANRDEPKSPTINKASRQTTQRAMRGVGATDQMRDMLSRMRDIDIDPDLEDYPSVEPRDNEVSVNVNTENLPAVAGEAIQAAGMTSPDFHQVAALPGNISAMIRQLGKTLFGSMTNTKTSEIYVVANLGGQGPNSNREVQSVANFVRENGEDMGSGDVDFSQVMPGYSAETHQYSAAGIRWLLVRDFAGQYIYCWPEADSKQIGGQQARLR